ncbi:MAG TPA: tetratricopeptide repeat protein [Blastocatellia bacterium]|nr:tetratricopeptide repeat protein [Blastocatellia bacterium]
MAEAHAALAFTALCYDWDWKAAEDQLKRALELNPNYAPAHQWYSNLLAARGRFDEAVDEIKRAQEIDPLSLMDKSITGWTYYHARRFDLAIAEVLRALEMDRTFGNGYMVLSMALEQKGQVDESISAARRSLEILEGSTLPLFALGHALAVSKRRDEALAVVDRLKKTYEESYASPYQIAVVYTGLQDHDRAFEWLEKAYESHDEWLLWLGTEPKLDPLRSDPRLASLMARVGLADCAALRRANPERRPEAQDARSAGLPAEAVGRRPF